MNIINKSKGPIYYWTSFPGAGDCGRIELGGEQYIGYPDVTGSISISLLSDDNSTQRSSQTFPVRGSSDVVVSITVS